LPFVAGAALALTAGACDKGQLKGAQAEVKQHNIKVDLPAVPAFDLPKPVGDAHTVKEMRVMGKQYLDQEVKVHGFVTWVYDCVTALRTPDMTEAQVKKMIKDDPTKCRRPAFYMGDTTDTAVERSAWVVEVPREMREDEKKNLTKEEKEAWPAVPPYKVGDEVEVTGDWKLTSPHGERNSEGLLIYKSMHNITQDWTTPPPKDIPGGAPAEAPATKRPPKH